MASKRIRLTKSAMAGVPFGEGWIVVSDRQVNGIKLYSGKAKKTLYLRRRINGSARDFKLCAWEPELSPEQIRNKALKLANQIIDGSDPSREKKEKAAREISLGDAFEAYIRTRRMGKNAIKPSTEEQYRFAYQTDLAKWEHRSLTSLTGDDVEEMHVSRSKESPSRANMATRLLSQIYRYAAEKYRDTNGRPLITYNPADRVAALRLQNKIPRRTGVISQSQMADWFRALESLEPNKADPTVIKDLFEFTILTGLRKNEAAQLEWDRVNLDGASYVIVENKSKRPVELPLSDYLVTMLKRRKESAGRRRYAFPAGTKSSYLKDWRHWCKEITKASQVEFMPHDLRRTFITIAESLDISPYAIKALVNHSLPSDDVTGGYIQIDVERLRGPMQQITEFILDRGGLSQ